MKNFCTVGIVICVVLLGGTREGFGAKLNLNGKTVQEVEEEARQTGVVQRALRGKLLLKTVTGVLHLQYRDGALDGATVEANSEEVHLFQMGEGARNTILETQKRESKAIFVIPKSAEHFSLIQPYMDGKEVEAQFMLTRPGGETVENLRFVGVLRGQVVDIPHESLPGVEPPDQSPMQKAYYVAINGNDSDGGSREKPFRSIQKGVGALAVGDTLYLRGGIYHEAFHIQNLKGAGNGRTVVSGYASEKVVLDGREDLEEIADGPWEKLAGDIYRRRLKKPVWQLWKDGEMLMLARWPKISKNWTEAMNPMFDGRDPEPGTAWDYDSYFARFDPAEARTNFKVNRNKDAYDPDYSFAASPYDDQKQVRKAVISSLNPLSAVGKSLEGAMVEGLSGSVAMVIRHAAGSEQFEVVFNPSDEKFVDEIARGRFVIKNHLNCLDLPKEWYFEAKTNTVYVKMAAGDQPEKHRYLGKTVALEARVVGSSKVQVEKIDFVACSFSALNSPGTVVSECNFYYPTYRPIALGFEMPERGVTGRVRVESKFVDECALKFEPGGTLYDCELAYYQSSGVEFMGQGARIENCVLHSGERYGVIFTRSPGCVARRNTIYSTLSQGAIRIRKTPEGGFVSELNYGYDFGTWRSDASGTQVQSGSQNFHVFRHNWFHHSECKASRFDGQPAGTLGTMVGNVGWRLWQGLQVKGDYQKAFNNTFFECGARCDISVVNQIGFGGGTHSITRNNLCDRISGHRTSVDLEGEGRIPGTHDHNWNGLVTQQQARDLLRDPDNFDFRPRNRPDIVDAGTEQVDDRFVPGALIDNLVYAKAEGQNTQGAFDDPAFRGGGSRKTHVRRYLGKAPDIGAYEYGDRHYWIPGRQLKMASFPIPPDKADSVKVDADLMWLEGKGTVGHRVYLGTRYDQVAGADQDDSEYMGRFVGGNIFTPKTKLEIGTTYYWRVDAVQQDGTALKGKVWRFTPEDR